jgi:hypothetical protein
MVNLNAALSDWQPEVLRWIADGCPSGVITSSSYKTTVPPPHIGTAALGRVAWTSYAPPVNQQWVSVATSSRDRAWAIGYGYSARWNGSAWTPVHIPRHVALLFGITMAGSSVWAAGEEFARGGEFP